MEEQRKGEHCWKAARDGAAQVKLIGRNVPGYESRTRSRGQDMEVFIVKDKKFIQDLEVERKLG